MKSSYPIITDTVLTVVDISSDFVVEAYLCTNLGPESDGAYIVRQAIYTGRLFQTLKLANHGSFIILSSPLSLIQYSKKS